ncbi:MAG: peptidyl-prolyl cis-trans isomerase [Myxococcota bacterium]|nr:peptidyl-prolyl cis-trans isomerase [Myxococcota bacterium]
MGEPDGRRGALALSLGAALGIGLAAWSILAGEAAPGRVPAGAVALVNGRPIDREAFARFVGAAARERGSLELDDAEQRRLLDRLIDEELLLQRGLELGLPRREPQARRAIVTAVVDEVTSSEQPAPAGRDELEAFYAEHAARFARPGPVEVEVAQVEVGATGEVVAHRRAGELARRWRAGEPSPVVLAELGDPLDPPAPAGLVPIDTLRRRFGGAAVARVLALDPGDVGAPARGPDGYLVFRLVRRAPDEVPPLDAVLDDVRSAHRRQQHDRRLLRFLEERRRAAEIVILDPALRDVDG